MINGLSGIVWLLFIQFKDVDTPIQYGPFTSEHACIEAATEMKRFSGGQIQKTWCFAS